MDQSVSNRMPTLNPRSRRQSPPYAPRNASFHPGILVGDGDQAIRALMGEALGNHGFKVFLAADGEEALELYGLHQRAIDFVLLDVHMPTLDGPESLKVLRDFDQAVACCFMSDGLGAYTMEDLKALTPLPFFEKPLRVIKTVEALWQVARQRSPSEKEEHRH